ncbi:MAG: isoprenyl transferase [Andreesenia angusta]|nr:isoprenyl transferase [Andreesenia angusta]
MDLKDYNIDMKKIPKHVAIIMDGNGRWAKKRLMPRTAGHKVGVERVRDIIKAVDKLNIKYLTLYAFSTENWKRPSDEVGVLMQLLANYLKKEIDELDRKNVRIRVLGELDRIPKKVREEIEKAIIRTKDNDNIVLNIALNYGSRLEIIRAVKNIVEDCSNEKLDIERLDEEKFKEYLYTEDQPDPDLMIRTSGEQRLSNFLLYQLAYSEFIFTETAWPDFTEDEFFKAIELYQNRNRRFGDIK